MSTTALRMYNLSKMDHPRTWATIVVSGTGKRCRSSGVSRLTMKDEGVKAPRRRCRSHLVVLFFCSGCFVLFQ